MEQSTPAQAVLDRGVSTHRALVLMNPHADKCSPEEVKNSLAKSFDPRGWASDVVEVKSLEQLDEAAERARGGNYDLVVAAGGNGTVSRVARHLVGLETPLGIIPVGRDNSLSMDLGISQDSDEAAALLVGEHETGYLDSLRVGDRHFFLQVGTAVANVATESVAPDGAEATQGAADLRTKIRKGIGFESHRFSLLVDGRHYRVSAWQVMAVNTGVVGSELLRAGPPIHPSDGTAEMVVFQIRSAMDLFRSALGLLNGRGEHAIDISYHRTRQKMAIIPDSPMPVQADGEAIGHTPVEIEVVPGVVRVVVPKAAPTLAPGVAAKTEDLGRHRRKAGWFRAAMLHRLGPLGALDTGLYIAVSRMPHPPFLDFLMQSLEVGMSSGRGWIAGVIAANLLLRRRPWKDLVNLVPSLWISSLLTEYPIKEVFARPRPFASVVMMPVVGRKPSSHSFPSGHSASAFAGAWLLSRRHPRLSPAFYAFAALVAFSRVYQGVHYPSDVMIGAATGTGLAAIYRVTLGDLIRRLTRRWV